MVKQSTPYRVNMYHVRLKEFWNMQSIVHRPSYNADIDPAPWKAHDFLNAWLRKEADELFNLGINVYH
jgi:hypothetical protein